MEKIFKYILVTVCLITSLSLFSIDKAYARTSTNVEIKSEKADLFIFIRVYENDRWYIHVYTEGGIFVAKVVEL